MQEYIINFNQLELKDLEQVGGKNASLGEMIRHLTKAGIRVPQGFATTAKAYHLFLEQSGLQPKITAALAKLNVDDISALTRTGAQIRQWIMETPLLPELETAISKAYAELQQGMTDGVKPIVFATLVNADILAEIAKCDAFMLDFFNVFINPLETELQTRSSHRVGRTHGMVDYNTYKSRIDAVNYALSHDDGMSVRDFGRADIILVGVSRCGKTPTCLYLALQFGVFAANYPFTEDDMSHLAIPDFLRDHKDKLFGLTIEPDRLHAIRSERRPNSQYAALEQCQREVQKVEALFKQEQLPFLSTTTRSIEEISTTVLAAMGISRRLL